MSTNADTVTATTATPAAKTVADDMPARRIFANIGDATTYLQSMAESLSDFGTTPLVAPKMDDAGNFDSATYSGAVMVAVLRKERRVKAIVVAPIPTVEELLANEAGKEFVEKVIQKELNHVAVRHLRDAEDVTTMVDQVPTTLDGYVTSGRDGTGGIMETYDELYKQINAALSTSLAVWAKARFTKGELKKALESKGYALEYYAAQEDYKGESLFEAALKLGSNAAKRRGLDPAIFDRWAATRDQKAFTPGDDSEEEALDLDALASAMVEAPAAPAPSEAPAA